MAQTAVEWLEQEIRKLNIKVDGAIQDSAIKILEQAKQMFEQQIIIASEEAFNSTSEYYRDGALDSEAPLFGVLYYNETYGK